MKAGTNPDFVIRKARPADLLQLMQLETTAFRCEQLSRRRMRHWIDAANGILLVAVPADKRPQVLGYALAFTRSDSPVARTYSLAIAPQARGKGLGRTLMESIATACKRRGCTAIRLEVAQNNKVALSLYEALNYSRYMSLPGYYADGQDAWRMQKTLS